MVARGPFSSFISLIIITPTVAIKTRNIKPAPNPNVENTPNPRAKKPWKEIFVSSRPIHAATAIIAAKNSSERRRIAGNRPFFVNASQPFFINQVVALVAVYRFPKLLGIIDHIQTFQQSLSPMGINIKFCQDVASQNTCWVSRSMVISGSASLIKNCCSFFTSVSGNTTGNKPLLNELL